MSASVGSIFCTDCDSRVAVQFTCAFMKGKKLTVASFGRCTVCYRTRNDHRSLRAHVDMEREDIYEAIKNGLFVLAIP